MSNTPVHTPVHDAPGATDEVPEPLPSMNLVIRPWADPMLDRVGYDPRSAYVERFWLGILGPSTVLLLRHLADGLDECPTGFTIDLGETAGRLGIGMKGGRNSPFIRTVERVCRFGAAQWQGSASLAVRRRLAPLNQRQIERLSPALQTQHRIWLAADDNGDEVARMRERARGLALSLLDLGESATSAEQQLHRWHFHPAVAHEAMRWAEGRRT